MDEEDADVLCEDRLRTFLNLPMDIIWDKPVVLECVCAERRRCFQELSLAFDVDEDEIECTCIADKARSSPELSVIADFDEEAVECPRVERKRTLLELPLALSAGEEAIEGLNARNRNILREVKVETHVGKKPSMRPEDWNGFSHVTAETMTECGTPRSNFGYLPPLTLKAFGPYKFFAEFALEGTLKTFSVYSTVESRLTFDDQVTAMKCFLLNLVDMSSLMELEHPGYAVDRTGIYPEPKWIARITETLDEVCVTFP
ncbi:MAG: hypothetical protein MMC33_004971 [Icmadophila ericetorum]|nr:hypothetical protein [Icmadophila ericetorum]